LQKDNRISIDLVIRIFQQIKETTAGLRPPQAQVVIRQGQSESDQEKLFTPLQVVRKL
jgi:hypothetical protein